MRYRGVGAAVFGTYRTVKSAPALLALRRQARQWRLPERRSRYVLASSKTCPLAQRVFFAFAATQLLPHRTLLDLVILRKCSGFTQRKLLHRCTTHSPSGMNSRNNSNEMR